MCRLGALIDDPKETMLRLNSERRLTASVLLAVLRFCRQDHRRGSFSIPALESLLQYRVVVATCAMAGVLVSKGVPTGHFTHILYGRGDGVARRGCRAHSRAHPPRCA